MTPTTHLAVARGLALAADIRRLRRTASGFLVVKGPVLAAAYPDPTTRRCRDLDVVVRQRDVRAFIDEVVAAGGTLLDANWDAAVRERWGQVHLRMPHGTVVDLHWHLINAGRVRDTLAVDMDDVWRDLRSVAVPGGTVWTMSVTNTAVHVALHAALGGAWQTRWFDDIRAVVALEPIDWDGVVTRARAWRVARLVGVALHRASAFGGADVPRAVIDALLPRGLTAAAIDRIDASFPPTTTTRDRSLARLWPHVVRDDWRATVRAATWRVERRLRNGLLGFERTRSVPHEMLPSGGDAVRDRFLRAVESGAWQ